MKLLSKLPRVVYSAFTQYSGQIQVVDFGPIRRLLVGGLVQSVSLNEENLKAKVWGRLARPPFELPIGPKVLMLGLGGGTTAHLLFKNFQPSLIRVVEIDSQIIEIAKNYFDLEKIPNLEVVNEDAFDYLDEIYYPSGPDSSPSTRLRFRMSGEEFDYVIVDLYAGKHFPSQANERRLYEKIKEILKESGGCVVNRIFAEDEKDSRRAYFNLLKQIFPKVDEQTIPGTKHFKNYLYCLLSLDSLSLSR